jgi:hypothetical protein
MRSITTAPKRQFRTIKIFDDLSDLLAQGDSDSVERIVSEPHLNLVQQRAASDLLLSQRRHCIDEARPTCRKNTRQERRGDEH